MVGHKFLEVMAEGNTNNEFELITFCEESRVAYDRVHLSEFFSGKSAEDLSLVPEGFYETHNITAYIGDKAESIDRANKQVTSASGKVVSYDKLILAMGSFPFVPPVPGHERDNCLVYRTIDDLEAITAAAKNATVGAVVGGGLLGLEAAKALKDLGLKTHVVEFSPRLMAVQVDESGGALLKRKIEALGVSVHTGKNTQSITDGDQHKHVMSFADGEKLETDIILFSAGIRPRDELARECELELGERGGIKINNACQTSDEDIYAIGEVALWDNKIFGLVSPGYQMASVAAEQVLATQDAKEFTGADMSTKLKLMGVDVASIGDAHAKTPGAKAYSLIDESNDIYKKIVVSEDGKQLLGSVLIGNADEYGNLLQFMLNSMELPEHPEDLILPQREGSASVGLGVDALPQSAVICSCNNVTKGDLCAAIEGGAVEISELKACTKAATSCGGCAALTKQVLDNELEKQGIEVKKDICEHIPYSRQEIYHLVRVGKIKTFAEFLSTHGKGFGCDICKPTVASVLASCWNGYILEDELATLQDTNDYFMANMQKNGTYSVVPRVPGGEITPDKLIAIGSVAKEFDLYTKITGGQRIDLFGAQSHQLPEIWKKLIDAGFETGHAYGKSVRTVKSCVGSTWCRYGVDDSVGLSIEIENRYKGLRSPHKLKFAVSGCTRECAEAQSKDVGIIATENGWNLYVCGNGGMKPRHTDLLASDLDKETLIKYIDRFLMFYVRTSDRLQRTSVWMDNLEGGLEYLKQVVCEDSLGLAKELESEMQSVIGTYQCEWKTTIEDPEKMKRFSHFVNTDVSDNNVVYVKEREQIRPARKEERIEIAPA
ncbi:MAG: nitrite reductase large subunit NirB [Pseudomonadales bacterium]|nr:nitrite reductase large subunit NirB [Pseudomonadales bacterium]